ncbi:MAG TPA: trehalase family glycosidase [Gemmatimonadota bacterium]|nr:trehalase family glycosidase [Gemmatimonadota bacterium]
MNDPLQLLQRTDKFYLGSGQGIIWAPRFPRWLEAPGFWDEAHVYHYELAPIFTVTLLGERGDPPGRPLVSRQTDRRWTPAELVVTYALDDTLSAEEHRSVLPGGYFLSEWKIQNRGGSARKLLGVAWTAQETAGLDLTSVQAAAGAVGFNKMLQDRHVHRLSVELSLEAPDGGLAGSAFLSEGTIAGPHWAFTPFPEKWRRGPTTSVQVAGVSPRGVLYAAVASPVTVPAKGGATLRLQARVRPLNVGEAQANSEVAYNIQKHAPPPQPETIARPTPGGEPGSASRAGWQEFFAGAPGLVCSDPFLQRYWSYRWYGLQLCGHEGGVGNHLYPGCCEGTGYFHVPITYSAQCHARELRWLSDPARARGVLLNILAHQKESGQLHGRIYVNHLAQTDFYFADWGDAVLAVDEVHPDDGFLRAVYNPLVRYADWLDRERDADGTGLCDVVDHFETGQEYMSRYMAVSPEADGETWGNLIRLKGIDASVYAYRLQRALAQIAARLGEESDAGRWTAAADRAGGAILESAWDPESGMFSDVDPRRAQRTGVKAAVCFYPYFTDLVGPEHVEGLRAHLLSPGEFWTVYPVPSTSVDDPYYSPDAEWKGKRHNCPWNGRVWPMANSHVVEAIAAAAIEHDPGLRERTVELIRKFIRMMFHGGDPARPNCYEHYNPDTGQPSLYRGFDDYQHSWVNDLIVKYVAGFRPAGGDSFVVDPFPFELESLLLSRLPFRGHHIDIGIEDNRFKVSVNGAVQAESTIGAPVALEL